LSSSFNVYDTSSLSPTAFFSFLEALWVGVFFSYFFSTFFRSTSLFCIWIFLSSWFIFFDFNIFTFFFYFIFFLFIFIFLFFFYLVLLNHFLMLCLLSFIFFCLLEASSSWWESYNYLVKFFNFSAILPISEDFPLYFLQFSHIRNISLMQASEVL